MAILGMVFVSIAGLVAIRKIAKAKRKVDEKISLLSNLPYISKHIAKAVRENLK